MLVANNYENDDDLLILVVGYTKQTIYQLCDFSLLEMRLIDNTRCNFIIIELSAS